MNRNVISVANLATKIISVMDATNTFAKNVMRQEFAELMKLKSIRGMRNDF